MKLLITAATILICSVCNSQTDTTKKEPIRYFLIGELPAWQLLFKAVTEPGKVTRDEIAGLSEWINRIQQLPTDTIQKPKTEGK